MCGVPGQARDGCVNVLRGVPDLEGVWMGCVAGDGATGAGVALFVTLQKRPPGGGRALPGLSSGQDGWTGRLCQTGIHDFNHKRVFLINPDFGQAATAKPAIRSREPS